jgi:hypothetical protein
MPANKENDVNITSLTGTVLHVGKILTAETFLLEIDVSIYKQTRMGPKLSTIKVVLFDTLAADHEADIVKGQRLFVSGEIDETAFYRDRSTLREFRVVGRFVKIIGPAVSA